MLEQVWKRITDQIKAEVNQASVNIFMNAIRPVGIEDDVLVFEAINDFGRDYVDRKFRGLIQKILNTGEPPLTFRLVTKTQERAEIRGGKPIQPGLPALTGEGGPDSESTTGERSSSPSRMLSGSASHPGVRHEMFLPKYTFDSFVVGKSNQFAHAVCKAVAAAPGTKHNPVFIYGGCGLGKTHLLQAIGHEVLKNNPKARVAYLSSETFTNEFIESLGNKRPQDFRAKFRKKDLLLIDDVQFFATKSAVIEEFFHTFNDLFQNKKQIILTSDSPPHKINNIGERLVSRFSMGVVADILPYDLEMRAAILKKAASRTAARVADDILMYLAENITTHVRDLEGAFNRVVVYAGIIQQPVDRDLVDHVLKDFFRDSAPGRVTIPWIQKRVAEYYDIPEEEMVSKRRSAGLVLPRQVAMRLSQIFTQSSLAQIGAAFGGRDHTTVMHAVDKINTRVKQETDFAEEFERIKRYVQPRAA